MPARGTTPDGVRRSGRVSASSYRYSGPDTRLTVGTPLTRVKEASVGMPCFVNSISEALTTVDEYRPCRLIARINVNFRLGLRFSRRTRGVRLSAW